MISPDPHPHPATTPAPPPQCCRYLALSMHHVFAYEYVCQIDVCLICAYYKCQGMDYNQYHELHAEYQNYHCNMITKEHMLSTMLHNPCT